MGQVNSSAAPLRVSLPRVDDLPRAESLQALMDREERSDLTEELPDECLASVFTKLSTDDRNKCSLVCKRWHWVDAKARSRLTLMARADLMTDVRAVLMRFEHLTSLSLKCHRKVQSIDDPTLELIGKLCKQLVKLKLKGCKSISDDGLEQFSMVCGSLKKLSCGSCGFGAKGLNAILQNCSELEDLSVKRLRRLIENPRLIVFGKGKLRRLSLKDLFNAQLFGTLIAGCKNLRTLLLARNPGYWDQLFEIVTGNLSELVELHCESLKMGDRALIAISRCTKLEVLHLSKATDCTDFGIGAVASGCGSLRKLHLDDRKSNRIGDKGLVTVGNKCAGLQELVLIGVNVTETSLGIIASTCNELERMALCNSESIGDAELACIAEKCVTLKKLCIKNCPIADHGLEMFASGCPNLLKLKVKKCKNVTPLSASWLQTNRASLTVSLDGPIEAMEGDQHPDQEHDRVIRVPTTVPCSSRSSFLKSKLTSAAGMLLKRLPKSSWLPAG